MPLASVGNSGEDIPSRQEVDQILNDPNVGMDVKRQLALEYIDYVEDVDNPSDAGFADEADRNGYRDYLKSLHGDWIDEGDINGNNGGLDDVKAAYTEAKTEFDKGQEKGRQGDRAAVNAGAEALQKIAGQASATNPGAATSDEILNSGAASLRVFEVFLPLVARGLAVSGGGVAIQFAEIKRLYFEQSGIPFTKFKAQADEFTAVNGAIVNSANDVSGKLRGSLDGWEGAAADRAHQFQQGYVEKTAAVAEVFHGAADGLLHTIGTIGATLREKVGWVQKYYFDQWGDVTAQDVERLLRVAELGSGASQNDFIHCIRFMDIESKDAYNDDAGSLDEDTITFLVGQAKKWLKGVFCAWFEEHIKNFQLMCANTRTAVDTAWKLYSDLLGKVSENPYVDVGKAPAGDPRDQGGGDQGAGKSGSGSGGSGPGSGGSGPGTPAMPKPPEMPKPEMPKPETPEPNINPVTHSPLETDPSTGQPYPIDPLTGAPVKDVAPDRDSMTVQQGANKISLEEPGPDGKMGISVDNGTGSPRDYTLDFGENGDKALPLADAATAYRPGPDGQIQIEDGNVKITAERPNGPDGQTVVTVDDGSGEPTKYTLGANDTELARQVDVGRHAAADAPMTGSGQQDPALRPHEQVVGDAGAGRSAAMPDGAVQAGSPYAEPTVASADSSESTSAQSVTGSMSGSDLFDGGQDIPDFVDGGLGDTPSSDTEATSGSSSSQSSTGLGDAPGGVAATSTSGGMGMMGGMMGAGGGGGGGEDQERAASAYRVDGGLFDTASAGGRISGSLDDDSAIGSR
ncbi:hypothetical protein [Amycolatopsis sp.]|uniref:hypothetical protein n=1 Tax=Amycolatopsis sp. TaxID=37632 RepID=UPI002E0836E0|nr:hypothetical protein [Amycolatopsis sp.]